MPLFKVDKNNYIELQNTIYIRFYEYEGNREGTQIRTKFIQKYKGGSNEISFNNETQADLIAELRRRVEELSL